MRTHRLPGDPALSLQTFLVERRPALELDNADRGLFIGLGLPDGWTPAGPPAVAVFDDGGPTRWPISTSPLLRITVWSDGRSRSRHVAARVMGLALASVVPGIVSIREPSTILDARDGDNGGLMASFTIRTTARTVAP